MDVETTTPAGQPIVSREKTSPFLIRTFIKIGSFHRLTLFEDGTLPTTDEQQIFTWKDATLRELLTSLRDIAPQTPEYRHPLARYSFRAIYADSAARGRFASKDLGIVYSRDILGEPGTLNSPAPRLLEDEDDGEEGGKEKSEREKEERTLDELRFVPGDYLCVAVLLPKNVNVVTGERDRDIAIKGSAGGASGPPATNGWRTGGAGGSARGDGGWGGSVAPISAGAPTGRGGGHWRGGSDIPPPISRGLGRGRGGGGGGGGGGDFAGRDRDYDSRMDSRGDRDRRVPPPRRDSPPHRGGGGRDRDRGGPRGGRRSLSRSRSRTPPRRKRYD
ncbi:hypothetical protein PILCRDRAFT_79224 [Piloderma croceum F 1598]|uniref:Histone deacetylase complex subunit SAP18 n=1 Tax=Piloderma croceum (strain F 1598) TaxID=765440 RepID=A0A0C3F5T5_PILCF|nr:hypothetical protein PILCRDRAFT_79224 [Piloderma croceum F 1598]